MSLPLPRSWRTWLILTAVATALTAPGLTTASATPAAPSGSDIPAGAATGSFVPLPVTRAIDTGSGVGAPKAPVPAQRDLNLTLGGRAGVPATPLVHAVSVNITVVKPQYKGWLIAYEWGESRPGVATANWVGGRSTTTSAVVDLSDDGRISLYNGAQKPVDVIIDVTGYYVRGEMPGAGAYQPVNQTRSLDTRNGIGARHSDWTEVPVEARAKTLSWQVTGRNGVPAGTRTVLMSITATNAKSAGTLAAFENQVSNPALIEYLPSTFTTPIAGMPYEAGVPVTKLFAVGLDAAGRAKLNSLDAGSSASDIDAVADVVGYYLGVGTTGAGLFQALAPAQVRERTLAAGQSITFPVAAPPGSTMTLAVKAAKTTGYGAVAVYTPGTTKPRPQLNYGPGRPDSTLVQVQTSPTSTVSLTNRSTTSAVVTVDQYGYQRGSALAKGTVWVAGANEAGQLAQGTFGVGSTVWSPVTGLSGVVAATASGNSAYAITTGGTLWAWGSNSNDDSSFNGGQLGDGTDVDRATPVRVKNLTKVTTVVAAPQSAYALQADGTVWSWGAGTYGADPENGPLTTREPLKVPGLSSVVALTIDRAEIVAVRANGTVWSWSTNPDSVPTQVPGLTGIVDADGNHLLRRDGRVLVNREVRAGLTDVVAIDGDYATRRDGSVYSIRTAQPTVRPPAPTSAAQLPEARLEPYQLSIALI